MADYDLGTAHGKVSVEGDASGVDAVNRKLDDFKRALTDIVGRVGAFQAGMNRIEAELKQVKNDFNNATDAADKYNRTVTIVHVSNQKTSGSTRTLGHDFRDLAANIALVSSAYSRHIVQLATLGNEFRKSSGGIIGFGAAMQRSGAMSTVLSLMAARFLGIGRALADVPNWQRHVLNFSNSLRLLTIGFVGLKAVGGDTFAKMFRSIADSSEFAGRTLDLFGQRVGRLLSNLNRIPQGMSQSIIGLAVFRNGMSNLLAPVRAITSAFEKLPGLWKAAIGAIAVAGPGIFEALGATLRFTSNLLVGLLQGAKQLAGGLLAIPGAFAMIGAAAVPLIGILFTLKSHFSDLFKDISSGDMQKATQDLAKLPSYLQPLGQAISAIIPQWKALGDTFTQTFTAGLGDQLKAISDTYLPGINAGGNLVAGQFKNMKDQFVGFLMQSQTVSDVNELFANTADTMSTVATAIQPVLNGLRDIGIVGSEFIKDLVREYLPGIAHGFEDWAAKARASGQLMAWMKGSVDAAKELWTGIKNVVQATWTLLTLFKTGTGDNFLKNFADSMTRFNRAVQQSASSGGLKQIGDAVRNIGTGHFEELVGLIESILPAIGQAIRFVTQLGTAFAGTFGSSIEIAAAALKVFIQGVNAVGGGGALGTILGLVAAWKLMGFVLGPIRGAIQAVIGAFNLMKGLDTLVKGIANSLNNMGSVGQSMSAKLTSGFSSARTAVGIFAGSILAAVAAFALYEQGASQLDAANKAIQDSAIHSKEAVENLTDAFAKDKGAAGDNVFDALKQSIASGMQDLDRQAQGPGVFGHIIGSFKDVFTGHLWGNTPEQDLEKASRSAKTASDSLGKLGATNADIARAIQSGGPAYDGLISKLQAMGDAGKPAIDFLNHQRDLYNQTSAGAKQFATTTAATADAINLASVATTNWDGSASTLVQVLARINVTADEANTAIMGTTTEYRKFLRTLDEKAGGKAPQGLIDGINELRQQFENGGQAVQQFSDAIDKLGDSSASAEEKAKSFVDALTQLNVIPNDDALIKYNEDIDNAIGYQSKLVDMLDKTGGALINQNGQLDLSSKNGQALSKTIRQIVEDNAALVESGRASPEEAYGHTTEALRDLFNKFNITNPADQQKLIDQYFPPSAFKDAIQKADPKSALEALFQNDPAKLDASIKLLDSNQDIVNRLVDPIDGKLHIPTVADVAPPVIPPPAPPAGPPGAPPGAPPAPAAPPPTSVLDSPVINPPAAPAAKPLLGSDPTQVMTLLMGNQDIANVLQPYIDKAANQGESLSQAFADGIQSGSPAVKDAIIKLAQLAGDGLGSSPAKYGPLSGDGWTFNRGVTFSTDWAGGISSASGIVKDAVKDAAYGAVTGMKEQPAEAFKQLTAMTKFIGDMVGFGKNLIDVFQSLNTLTGGQLSPKRYIPDPTRDPRRGTPLGSWSPQGWTPPTGAGAPAAGAPAAGGPGGANLYQDSAGKWHAHDPWWEGNIQAESGGNIAPSGNPTHFGLFQFAQGTWDSIAKLVAPEWVGKNPGTAPADVQAQIAQANYDQNKNNLSGQWVNPYVAANPAGTSGRIWSPNAAGTSTTGLNVPAPDSALGGINLSTIPVAAQKYANDCIDASARIILSHSGINKTEEELGDIIPRGSNIIAQAAGLNAINAAGKYLAIAGSGGSPDALFSAIKDSIDRGVGSILNVTPGSSIGGRNFSEGHFIAATGYNPDNTINLSDTARGTRYSVTAADAFQATRGRGIVVGTGTGPPPSQPITQQAGASADNPVNVALPTQDSNALQSTAANTGNLGDLSAQTQVSQALQDIGVPANITNQADAQTALQHIDTEITRQNTLQTPESKQMAEQLGQVHSDIQQQFGLKEAPSVLDMASSAAGIAGDVVNDISAGIEAVGAGKNIGDQLVRGIASTNDILGPGGLIDQFQKFITLAADITKTVGDVASTVGSMTGGADMGITSGIGQVTQLISSIIQGVNTAIDLGQEAWQIFGSYFGQFLGFLAGGDNMLMGNVKFLLDQNTGQLLSYSSDNPLNKNALPIPGAVVNPNANNQAIGQLNYYAGPGQDPRDSTRQMMYQVQASQMNTVTAQ